MFAAGPHQLVVSAAEQLLGAPVLAVQATRSGSLGCVRLPVVALLAVWMVAGDTFRTCFSRAHELLDHERDRTQAERDAFREFRDRVRAIGGTAPESTRDDALLVEPARKHPDTPSAEQVQTAFRETVLAVPHFDREYDETPAEHMRTELGNDATAAVLGGNSVSEPLRRTLLARARGRIDKCEDLLTFVEREKDALVSHERALADVTECLRDNRNALATQATFSQVQSQWVDLCDQQARCERLLETRQRTLQESITLHETVSSRREIVEYVYEPLSVRFPVLAAVLRVHERLDVARRRRLEILYEWNRRER